MLDFLDEIPLVAWLRRLVPRFITDAIVRVVRILLMVFLLGLSLLPLASLLLIFPAIYPQESVLNDTVRRRGLFWEIAERLFYFLSGIALLIALLAFATEVVTMFNFDRPYFGQLAKFILPERLIERLPKAMIEQWPYVLLIVYASDLAMLFAIGKVPFSYNIRNLVVRWRITVLTAMAFTVVVALLSVMLAFVNGLDRLTSSSGIPGNVFILSEGATDELFSSLGYGDMNKIDEKNATYDKNGQTVARPVGVKKVTKPGGREVSLVSKETYFVINHPVPVKAGERPKRRFVQLRGLEDAFIACQVHNIKLLKEGAWFEPEKMFIMPDGTEALPAILGESAAAKFGEDVGKPTLAIGDAFTLGDIRMVVFNIMKTEGSTFGSEVWATRDYLGKQFGKTQITTIVLRVDDDTLESAETMASFKSKDFTNPRIRAVTEQKYYEDLGKSNEQMLMSVLVVAIIMAVGGVFGVMNTMFAAIAQRTKDIGVLRILGFKRWQILISFMIESLSIALIGGVVGMLLGTLADGFQVTSNLSSGQGSGKTVILKMIVDADIMILGVLFTIVMGRVGGLVPALTAMRQGILESLK